MFAKYPEKGRVKTRLASTLGEETAAELYRLFVDQILTEIKKLNEDRFSVMFFFPPNDDFDEIKNWIGSSLLIKKQIGQNLGEKMHNAFDEIFIEGFSQAIIIGTDIPDINAELIKKAASALKNYDLIIGPCVDGGYYLLGMKNLRRELFPGINWSTNGVLSETLSRARDCKLKVKLIEELWDIDAEQDLYLWINQNNTNTNLKNMIRKKLNYVKT